MTEKPETTRRRQGQRGEWKCILGYDAKALDNWWGRFIKRFLDRIETSEVISSETFDSPYLFEIQKEFVYDTVRTIRPIEGVADGTDHVVVATVNGPELCADIAFLALERRNN